MKTNNLKCTEKEILILKGLELGKCCKTIANDMKIKISTVNTHCKRMLRKFNQTKMHGVLALAMKKGYLKKI